MIEYGVSAEENERLGLPCGGRLEVLVQQLRPGHSQWVHEAVTALKERKSLTRTTDLVSGATSTAITDQFVPLRLENERLVQGLGPRMQMLLVGAGQLAQVLAQLALAMDYEVLVTDTGTPFSPNGRVRRYPCCMACPMTLSPSTAGTPAMSSSRSPTIQELTTWPCSRPWRRRPGTSAHSDHCEPRRVDWSVWRPGCI